MKKLFCSLLFVLVGFSLFAYNVSFLSYTEGNKAIAKVSYSVEKKGEPQIVDLSKSYSISSEDKIYISFTKVDNIKVKSVLLRCWDGESSLKRVLELQSSEDGQLFFCLGDLGPATEWSVEPILERIPIELNFEALCNGELIGGTWKVNSDIVNGNSASISSLTDYSVSYKFDDENYYFVSSSPKQLACSNGKIVFSLQKPSEESKVETSYTINLEKYSTVSFGDNKDKITGVIYKETEYSEDSVKDLKLKLKRGETFSVYTKGYYAVEKGSGLCINSQTKTLDGNWVTTLQVPEESTVYNYVANICQIKSVTFPVELLNFAKDEDIVKPSVTISGAAVSLSFNGDNDSTSVEVKESDTLGISISKPTESNFKYSIEFQSNDGSLSKYNKGDIREDYSVNFSYNEIATLKKIIIKREKGFRVNGIETQIKKGKDSGIELSYCYTESGVKLKDGDFVSFGTRISVEVLSSIPEDREIRINGKVLQTRELVEILEIDNDSLISNFEFEIKEVPGFYFDFNNLSYENGTVTFTRNDVVLKGNTFIKVGDEIQWHASSFDGYATSSGIEEGKIIISTEEQGYKFKEIRFVPKSELIQRKITLKNSKLGTVKYFDSNEKEISGSTEGDIYTIYEYSIANDEIMSFKYQYTDKTEGFTERSFEGLLKEDGWSYVKDGNYITCEKKSEDGTNEYIFTPLELEEPEDKKIELSINVNNSVLKVASKLDLYFVNDEKNDPNYIYKNGEYTGSKFLWNKLPFKISSTDKLELHFSGYQLDDKKALQIACVITDDKGKQNGPYEYRTSKGTKEIEIAYTQTIKFKRTKVTKIDLTLSIIDVSSFEEREKENATVEVYYKGKVLNSEYPMQASDKVSFKVTPNDGYYLKVNGKNQEGLYESENISYKDLDAKLANVEVKKYISVTLPDEEKAPEAKYSQENETLEPGKTYDFKEGDVISITLPSQGYKKSSSNFFTDTWNSIFDKNYIRSEITITPDFNKTLTLDDFGISKK